LVAGLVATALAVAGCSGGGGSGAAIDDPMAAELGLTDDADDGGEEAEDAAEEAVEDDRMPDVVGMPADEAVELLEGLGFRVSTGVVRTTERDPDLVHRSEPAPGTRIQPGQGVTLRVAAEPRE
jgi:hypothetical protein